MKILLIHPPPLKSDLHSNTIYPPLGLTYIAGVLRKSDHDVSILDAHAVGSTIQDIVNYVKKDSPDLVGITSTTPGIFNAFSVANAIKNFNPELKVIMGGVHPTVAPEHVLESSNVDIIVRGEGEITMCELVDALGNGKQLKKIKGIGYKKNGRIIITPLRELIKDLDSLPYPAYDLLPIEKYTAPTVSKKPFMTMMTSRGCPYNCIFCGVQSVFGRTYRYHSPERTIEETEYLIENFGVREIFFKDSEFTLKSKRVNEICDLMMKRGIKISWMCNGRANHMEKGMVQKMKRAGCRLVTLGIESGDQRILNNLKKQITLDDAKKAVATAQEAGMEVISNFLVGNPGDTKETIEKTIAFAKELGSDYTLFGFIAPFPGTELYEMAKENDWLLKGDGWENIKYDTCTMNATEIPLEELEGYLSKAYRSYYFTPKYLLRRLKRFHLEEFKNSIKGFMTILNMPRS